METKSWIVFKSNHNEPESKTAYDKLTRVNREAIDKWLNEKVILSKAKKRGDNRKRAIIKLLTFVKKNYDKLEYQDYVNVALAISKSSLGANQKNDERNFIIRFIKDNYPDYEIKFKGLTLLKMEIKGEDKKISPKDLLTDSEIEKLLNATSDMKKKGLIVVLSVSAGRPEEILKLRWHDVDFKKKIIYLYSGKTKKKRAVPIDSAINHLERLKAERDSSDEDLIFPSVSGKIITIAGLNFMLHELGKKAGIKKRIWAYLFRHTRLSFLITKLSPKVYEEVSGHSLEMGMRTYAHLSQDKIIQEMNEKVFELKDLSSDDKTEYEKRIAELEKRDEIRQNDIRAILHELEKKKLIMLERK